MQTILKIIMFLVIWSCVLGSTHWVWVEFGWILGLLYFLFVAGLAGFLGMLAVIGIAKLFGIEIED